MVKSGAERVKAEIWSRTRVIGGTTDGPSFCLGLAVGAPALLRQPGVDRYPQRREPWGVVAPSAFLENPQNLTHVPQPAMKQTPPTAANLLAAITTGLDSGEIGSAGVRVRCLKSVKAEI